MTASATDTGSSYSRRAVLRAGAGATLGAAALGTVPQGVAAAGESDEFTAWFDGVENYEGVVDERGESTVTVSVGAPGNGGAFAFEPAAVRVDPGTTVVWEWTGDGDAHSIAAADGSYEADLTDAAGSTFALRFDGVGVSRYACPSHASEAMRGAVVVGDPMAGVVDVPEATVFVAGGVLGAVLSPLAFVAFLALRGTGDGAPTPEFATAGRPATRAVGDRPRDEGSRRA